MKFIISNLPQKLAIGSKAMLDFTTYQRERARQLCGGENDTNQQSSTVNQSSLLIRVTKLRN